ncbi:MAG: MFS transporter [Gammaproteobacteria bacterium]|nr:MFS transporter [Gammaproteobacteria bacterium]
MARVGHIRVFAVLAALASVAVLLLGLIQTIELWIFARALTGWAFSGLYMVIESWLNERSGGPHRGAVLSVYTVITLAAIALGQLAVGFGADYSTLTIIAAMIFMLGMIPVGLTRSTAPPIEPVSFRFKEVFKASQVAVVCAFVGGSVTSGVWALGPIVAAAMGMPLGQVGLFMAITIMGGAVLQFPVGRLSDFTDRRNVILGLAVVGAAVCLAAILHGQFESRISIFVLMFIFGGVTFPLYSLAVATANDNTELGIMEISSVVLLMHSFGSILGPLVVAPLMDVVTEGLFAFSGVVLAAFALWTSWRLRVHEVARRYFVPFIGIPRTTQEIGYALDHELADEVEELEDTPPSR